MCPSLITINPWKEGQKNDYVTIYLMLIFPMSKALRIHSAFDPNEGKINVR